MLQSSKARRNLGIFALSVLILSVLALSFASPARAAEIITGEPDAILPADQVVDDDLFIAGQNVRIEGTVNGDVFAAGNRVEVTGIIDGNLFVGGQLVTLSGSVNGSVYAGGSAVITGPNAAISDNLYGFAFALQNEAGSFVGRSMYAFSYQAMLSGQVTRDLNFFGSALRMDGAVGRNLKAEISESSDYDPYQSGPWMMWVPANIEIMQPGHDISRGSVGGETDIQVVEYQAPTQTDVPVEPQTLWGLAVAGWVIDRVGEFISLFLVGALLFLVWPAQMKRVEDQITGHTLRSLGLGVLAAILFPFAFVLAVFVVILLAILLGVVSLGQLVGPILTLGFLLIALATAAFFVAGFLGAKAIFGHLVGSRLLGASTEDKGWGLLLILLVGLLLYEIVALIPILGWLVGLVVVLLGWGAIAGLLWFKDKQPQTRTKRKARR